VQESTSVMPSFVTRRPVLDRSEGVYGYELRARSGGQGLWRPLSGDGAGEIASSRTPVLEGFEDIIDGTLAFIP
jgi:c-di-GMP-related signal transduction protein